MLSVRHIFKEYHTGKISHQALRDVSLDFRDHEFVAVLGPSGSGKTTLLNIIGGLDRYDSGDMIIDGISTGKYKDRDWDSYRNHSIGFVFQSYNLIPHQTVLVNVEMALTISGIGKAKRRARAMRALEEVGLGDQVDKLPNQLSGGQMQRVAIARALVNNPTILLADEPTGALDSVTSLQVLDLLAEVAKERLVVMVTHNPELADRYADRIVRLKDGEIISDSMPYMAAESESEPVYKNMGRAFMSFPTALMLSLKNLGTKRKRAILTSFAGSIGIIGIALILAISNAVNTYIANTEEQLLYSYPLEIADASFDFSSMLAGMMGNDGSEPDELPEGKIGVLSTAVNMFSSLDSNDLKSLRAYLESGASDIYDHVNAIEYSYDVTPMIYRIDDGEARQVHPDISFSSLGLGSTVSASSIFASMMSTDVFYKLPDEESLYTEQYNVVAGTWPKNYDECVLVLTQGGEMSDLLLYTLGLRDTLELDEMISDFAAGDEVDPPSDLGTYDYDEVIGTEFRLICNADLYDYDSEYGVWVDKSGDADYVNALAADGEKLRVVGIVQRAEDSEAGMLSAGIYYSSDLTGHIIEESKLKQIVRQQILNPDTDVFTGEPFGESEEEEFDFAALFDIDEDVLSEAFGIDSDALAGGAAGFSADGIDLSSLADGFSTDGIDLSSLADGLFMDGIDLSSMAQMYDSDMDISSLLDLDDEMFSDVELPEMDFSGVFDSLSLQFSPDQMFSVAEQFFDGYEKYAQETHTVLFSDIGDSFAEFLGTDEAESILAEHIGDIILENGDIELPTSAVEELTEQIMSGFLSHILAHGYTDSAQADAYLTEYLGTDEAREILGAWVSENLEISTDMNVSQPELYALTSDLAAGYVAWAVANGAINADDLTESFSEYMKSEGARAILAESLSSVIDTEGMEDALAAAMETYMGQVVSAYAGSMRDALSAKLSEAVSEIMEGIMSGVYSQIEESIASGLEGAIESYMEQAMSGMEEAASGYMNEIGESVAQAMDVNPEAFLEAFSFSMNESELMDLLTSLFSDEVSTYSGNLSKLGYADTDEPNGISIYPIDFVNKDAVVEILDDYNAQMEASGDDERVISYTDTVGTLMSSVTKIINMVSIALIALVAVSLVVSSIMIGVITYISVLERKKEIGILRALGASKRNISQVFNAETGIIGFCAGMMGVIIACLVLIPGNMIFHRMSDITNVSAALRLGNAVILVAISIALTLIGGLIPSRGAAKCDPVEALRAE